MNLTDQQLEFLHTHSSAAMITAASDGTPKAVRVGVSVVDDALWSSGTLDRVRTARLRDDPRCTVFVFDPGFTWLTLETTVTILDGADAPARNLQLFRAMQGRSTGSLNWFGEELDEGDFLQRMIDEQRLIYQFDVHRAYGLH